jgi:hypothetical protein
MTECTSFHLFRYESEELTLRRGYEMVQSPRSHVIVQDVHQINRRLVSRLYPSRDVERKTIIPRKGLVSTPFCSMRKKANDSHNQLQLILDVLGTPTIDEFYAITSRRSKEYIRSLAFRKKIPFKQLYPKASDEAIDFLDHTLTCMSFLLFLSLLPYHSILTMLSLHRPSPPAISRLLPPL